MRVIADFHFHSRFARSCWKDLTILNVERTAAFKGVHLLGTGDFTHPQWMAEIKRDLHSAPEAGLYCTDEKSPVRFVLTCEISSIYSQGGKTRRVHTVFVFPSLEAAEKFNQTLRKRGAKLAGDGRPIVGIPAKELAKIALDISPKAIVIPAHAWTPWFGVFGSMSGFDSLLECFEELTSQIFSIEMGMSSDASMNWRLSANDPITLLASSDAHSLHRIAREGNVFELSQRNQLSYDWVYATIKDKDSKKFPYTIKYYPQEGRYHYDGHAKCRFSCPPSQTKKLKGICPKCGGKLTVGVMARVEALADRPEGHTPKSPIPTKHLVPLEEIIAEALDKGVGTKTVQNEYEQLVKAAGGEYQVLLDLPIEELQKMTKPIITEGIKRVRGEKLHIEPGYDGEYGVINIFTPEERKELLGKKQDTLF